MLRRRRGARARRCWCCAATSRRARAGCCCTAATEAPKRSPPPSRRDVAAPARARCRPRPARSTLEAKGRVTFTAIARVLLRRHLRRTILGLSLMIAQAFAYNGVFFTYALVLSSFYGVPSERIGLYLLPFAFGNLLGPIVLGPLFDRVGRRTMIAVTYVAQRRADRADGGRDDRAAGSTPSSQTALWSASFFVASAAASSAYLTVSELLPGRAARDGDRALLSPSAPRPAASRRRRCSARLLETGSRSASSIGYLVGAALMIAAGVVAAILGVAAERKSLETLNALPDVTPAPTRPGRRVTGVAFPAAGMPGPIERLPPSTTCWSVRRASGRLLRVSSTRAAAPSAAH